LLSATVLPFRDSRIALSERTACIVHPDTPACKADIRMYIPKQKVGLANRRSGQRRRGSWKALLIGQPTVAHINTRRFAGGMSRRPETKAPATSCEPYGLCGGATAVSAVRDVRDRRVVGLANRRRWRKAMREWEAPVDWSADGDARQYEAVCRRNG
jgi:hypothetical protein